MNYFNNELFENFGRNGERNDERILKSYRFGITLG